MGGVSIFVFIDALGWEIVRDGPLLRDLAVVRQPLETVFGYSSTCDPTIITGRPPREHGHFSFFVHDPGHSPFRILKPLRFLPRSLVDRGRVRNAISKIVGRMYGYTGYFQLYSVPFEHIHLFDYTEKRDIYREGGINGGQPSVFVLLERAGIPHFRSDWRKGEAEAVADVRSALDSGRPRLVYLYLAKMDSILHADGTVSPRVDACIAGYDRMLRELLDFARERYDPVRLFVFGDHGMTDITDTCPLMERIASTGLAFGVDYSAVYDSTMARFWFLKPGAEEKIRRALERETKGRILDPGTLADWGVDFPGDRYGQLIFLMNPGVLLCPGFMGSRPIAGMHGFAPDHPGSKASFLSTVPLEPPPRGLADLFGLMKSEAGI